MVPRHRRGRRATFLGYPVGPIVGGWLLGHLWWGSVFLINVPVVVIAVIAVVFLMPESRAQRPPRIDGVGGGEPLADLALFRSAGIAWGSILSTMVSFALFGITFALPQGPGAGPGAAHGDEPRR